MMNADERRFRGHEGSRIKAREKTARYRPERSPPQDAKNSFPVLIHTRAQSRALIDQGLYLLAQSEKGRLVFDWYPDRDKHKVPICKTYWDRLI
jgi:hypothetical protein